MVQAQGGTHEKAAAAFVSCCRPSNQGRYGAPRTILVRCRTIWTEIEKYAATQGRRYSAAEYGGKRLNPIV
jgi:hypothetical protein